MPLTRGELGRSPTLRRHAYTQHKLSYPTNRRPTQKACSRYSCWII